MTAYYYRIREYNSLTCQKGKTILEGIIRNSEDIIFPGQEFIPEEGQLELPYECEAHRFNHPDYILQGWNIEITTDFCLTQKPKNHDSIL